MKEYRQIKFYFMALMALVLGGILVMNADQLQRATPLVGTLLLFLVLFDLHFFFRYPEKPIKGWRYLFYGVNLLVGTQLLYLLSSFENYTVAYFHFLLIILAGFYYSRREGMAIAISAATITVLHVFECGHFEILITYFLIIMGAVMLNGIHGNLRRLIEKHDETLSEVRTLYKISNIIDTFPSTEEILSRMVKVISDALGIEQAYILLLTDEEDALEVVAKYGRDLTEETHYGLKSSLAGWVYENEVKVFANDIDTDDFVQEKLQYHFGLSAIAVVPLIYQGFKFGVLITASKKQHFFKKRDDRFLDVIAKRVSMVLYNNHLYRNMEISAKTDALTGLYNQRTFYEIMAHKIKESQNQESNLHLVIMDIDKFKSFNDRFGHVLGDEVLKEIGRAIKRTIRSQDFGFRYGGEEFALLFESLDDERVKMVTERIQETIHEITDRIPVLREAGEVITVSVGISRYPEEKDNLIHLVEFADEKMYVAKEEGGNCIVC